MTEANMKEQRQMLWLVCAFFVLLLIPAAIARMTGWRWQPWAPGAHGYGSIFGEAKRSAMNFAPLAFAGL